MTEPTGLLITCQNIIQQESIKHNLEVFQKWRSVAAKIYYVWFSNEGKIINIKTTKLPQQEDYLENMLVVQMELHLKSEPPLPEPIFEFLDMRQMNRSQQMACHQLNIVIANIRKALNSNEWFSQFQSIQLQFRINPELKTRMP